MESHGVMRHIDTCAFGLAQAQNPLSDLNHGLPLWLWCAGAFWRTTTSGTREALRRGGRGGSSVRNSGLWGCGGDAGSRLLHSARLDAQQEEGHVVPELQPSLVLCVGLGGRRAGVGIRINWLGFCRVRRRAGVGDGLWRAGIGRIQWWAVLGIIRRHSCTTADIFRN